MLAAGTRIASYEIAGVLGSGGMGNVYRATDTRLGREVAIKTLPEHLSRDDQALARFEREARFLATLSHPNIATIYGIEEHDGRRFLILELVQGETIERLVPLPLERAMSFAMQIVTALEAAHDAGIVHRDLKPSNVKVTPADHVKLLDFGIAKAVAGGDNLSQAPTALHDLTRSGTVIGTPAYMSPEQFRGDTVDARTDIWSFGCLLFEMLAGRRAFDGRSYLELADAVRAIEPDWSALPRATPDSVRQLLHRCLRKDPHERLHSMADVRIELTAVDRHPSKPTFFDSIVSAFRRPRTEPAPTPTPILRLRQFTFAARIEEFPAWSRDGKSIAYSRDVGGIRKLFMKPLEGGDDVQLTSGDCDELQPAFSADGAGLLFVRARDAGRRLEPSDVFGHYGDEASTGDVWSIDIGTRRESRLVENAFNPAVAANGTIAVDASWGGSRRIWILNEHGRNPRQISSDATEAITHVRPSWSRDGSKLTYQQIERTKFNVAVADLETRRTVTITDDAYQNINPVWSPSGRFIYFSSYRGGGMNVWRVPVGPDGMPMGAPQQLTTGAGQDVQIAAAPDGRRLAYATLRQNADVWRLPLDASGKASGEPESVIATSREDSRGAWSPDGQQIAFNSDRTGDMNIWLFKLHDGATRQLTRGAGGDFQANWSPQGNEIAFFSSRSGHADIWKVDVESMKLTQLTRSKSLDINPFFSPDGSEIVYQSDASGRLELWVMQSDGSRPRQISDVGVAGHFMRWLPDGFIYFRSPAHGTMRIAPEGGTPELVTTNSGAHISFSPDGAKFIDVTGHKVLWLYGRDGSAEQLFAFGDPDIRIDYPVWSPDGKWLLFDRFKPDGGDIWIAENVE